MSIRTIGRRSIIVVPTSELRRLEETVRRVDGDIEKSHRFTTPEGNRGRLSRADGNLLAYLNTTSSLENLRDAVAVLFRKR